MKFASRKLPVSGSLGGRGASSWPVGLVGSGNVLLHRPIRLVIFRCSGTALDRVRHGLTGSVPVSRMQRSDRLVDDLRDALADLLAVDDPDALALELVGQRVERDLRAARIDGRVNGAAELVAAVGRRAEVQGLGLFPQRFGDDSVFAQQVERLLMPLSFDVPFDGFAGLTY